MYAYVWVSVFSFFPSSRYRDQRNKITTMHARFITHTRARGQEYAVAFRKFTLNRYFEIQNKENVRSCVKLRVRVKNTMYRLNGYKCVFIYYSCIHIGTRCNTIGFRERLNLYNTKTNAFVRVSPVFFTHPCRVVHEYAEKSIL